MGSDRWRACGDVGVPRADLSTQAIDIKGLLLSHEETFFGHIARKSFTRLAKNKFEDEASGPRCDHSANLPVASGLAARKVAPSAWTKHLDNISTDALKSLQLLMRWRTSAPPSSPDKQRWFPDLRISTPFQWLGGVKRSLRSRFLSFAAGGAAGTPVSL
jgi:hypothetical protein